MLEDVWVKRSDRLRRIVPKRRALPIHMKDGLRIVFSCYRGDHDAGRGRLGTARFSFW